MRNQLAELTDNGRELVELLWKMAKGEEPGAKARDILDARKYLADHYFGKAPETVLAATISAESMAAAKELSGDEIRQLARMSLERYLEPGERIISGEAGGASEGTIADGQAVVITDESN